MMNSLQPIMRRSPRGFSLQWRRQQLRPIPVALARHSVALVARSDFTVWSACSENGLHLTIPFVETGEVEARRASRSTYIATKAVPEELATTTLAAAKCRGRPAYDFGTDGGLRDSVVPGYSLIVPSKFLERERRGDPKSGRPISSARPPSM